MGECPADDAKERLEMVKCNEDKCMMMFPKESGVLECESMLDVVVLLDGSGSIGSEGWPRTQEFGKEIVKAFDPTAARVAVMIYSGPTSWSNYVNICVSTEQHPDFEKACNVKWVSHLTTDTDALVSGIENEEWPAGTTLTSAALGMAEVELQTARKDASSLVIVVTDGKPLNKMRTQQASEKLRQRARLMWVAVGDGAPMEDIVHWGSEPVSENVLKVKDFDELKESGTLNEIIADACLELK